MVLISLRKSSRPVKAHICLYKVTLIGPLRFISSNPDEGGTFKLAEVLGTLSGCDVTFVGNMEFKELLGKSKSFSNGNILKSSAVVWKVLNGRKLPGLMALNIVCNKNRRVKEDGGNYKNNSFRSLKQFSCWVTPLSEFNEILPRVDFIQGYGMTDSTAVGTRGYNSAEFHKYSFLSPNVEVKEVDWVMCSHLPLGSIDELWLCSPGNMKAHTVLEMNNTKQQLTAPVVSQQLRPVLASPESGATTSLISLIQRCWDSNPQNRPSFEDIISELDLMLGCGDDSSADSVIACDQEIKLILKVINSP